MKYELPDFLVGIVTREKYSKWLSRKATSIHKRDKRRYSDLKYTRAEYKEAIHKTVLSSNGLDYFTGEKLDWEKIGSYNNDRSKQLTREYRQMFWLLPTVDHYGKDPGVLDFKICGWRTNDSKSDLSYEEYLELCKLIIEESKVKTAGNNG